MEYLYKGLVREAKGGCHIAMEHLISKLNPLIYSAIRRYKRGEERDDLYQEACILIIESVREFDEAKGVPFLAYVKSRIYYGVHNLTRKTIYEPSLDESIWHENGKSLLESLEDEGAKIEELIINRENCYRLKKALEFLSQKQRDVITGHYFDGKKLKDIAIDRGVHYKAILQLKSRAMARLREEL